MIGDVQLLAERFNELSRLFVQVGDGQFRAQRAEGSGAAPGNRLIVGDADDQALLAVEEGRLGGGNCHAVLLYSGARARPADSRASVCLAIINSSSVGTTRSATRLSGADIVAAPAAFAAGSSVAPSQPSFSAMRARTRCRLLADAGGEDEGIEAAECGRQHAGMQADAVDEVVERQRRAWLGARQQLPYVIADAGEALQPTVLVEKLLNRGRAHRLLGDEVEHDARIELAGPRAHRQPVERGEPHGAFDAGAAKDRAHRRAAAEMRDDHATLGDFRRDFPQAGRRRIRRRGRGSHSGGRLPHRNARGGRNGRPRRYDHGGMPYRNRRPAADPETARAARGSAPGCWAGARAPVARSVPGAPGSR